MTTSTPPEAPPSRGRVLIVDDDAALAEMLSIVLAGEGFESRVCERGDLAPALAAVTH